MVVMVETKPWAYGERATFTIAHRSPRRFVRNVQRDTMIAYCRDRETAFANYNHQYAVDMI